MSKLDKILAATGANIDESMGAGRAARPLNGSAPRTAVSGSARLQGLVRSKSAAEIPVDRIINDLDQPREEFDEESLARLAGSLRTRGQLQPIRVRWDEGRGKYVIVCGERRWRAAKMAGLTTLSCVIMEGPAGPGELLALQLIENAVREDLRPIEQAKSYRALMDLHRWTTRELAAELAIDAGGVTKALALLDLPAAVQAQVELGGLAASTAYEVSKLPDAETQAEVAHAAVEQQLTRSEVAEVVKAVRAKRPAPILRPDPVSYDLGDCTVTVKWKKGGGSTATQALRRAAKVAQEQERGKDDQAA
jgi:ParB family transcriptional regulator, chromosome partitioning protein